MKKYIGWVVFGIYLLLMGIASAVADGEDFHMFMHIVSLICMVIMAVAIQEE